MIIPWVLLNIIGFVTYTIDENNYAEGTALDQYSSSKDNQMRSRRSSSNRFSFRDNPFLFHVSDEDAHGDPAHKIKAFHETIKKLVDQKAHGFDYIHRFGPFADRFSAPIEPAEETHIQEYDIYDDIDYSPNYMNDYSWLYEYDPLPKPLPKAWPQMPGPLMLPTHQSTSQPQISSSKIVVTNNPLVTDEIHQTTEESTVVGGITGRYKASPLLAVESTISPGCSDGWTHDPDSQKCYKVFTHALTWSRSERHCEATGGHLASIGSAIEESFIHNLLRTGSMPASYNKIWIGLRRTCEAQSQSCDPAWTDGSNTTFLKWRSGGIEYSDTENCGAADLVTMKIYVKTCQTYYPYVCEMPQGTLVPDLAPLTDPPVEYCEGNDSSWRLHDGHCYKAVSANEEKHSFWKSRKRCQEVGADLVSIHSLEENHFINTMIYRLSDITLWVGGEANMESGFHWVDDSSFSFFIWAPDEPNNAYGQEKCVNIYTRHNNGYWNDDNCARKMGYICKRPNRETLPPLSTTLIPRGHCPEGWSHLGTHCLQVFGIFNATNWSDARQHCTSLAPGADLASVHNIREQAAITALVAAVGYNVWIGFFEHNGFHWSDQSEMDFTNWATGEPNGKINMRREQCVEVIGSSYQQRGRWNDIRCSTNLGYICQMPTDPTIEQHQQPPTCDGDYAQYFNYSGACYKPVAQQETWEDAEAQCINEGAHLASILDIAENSYLYLLAVEKEFSNVWIGLNTLKDSSRDYHQFTWSDGWPVLLSNWGPNQPNTNLSDHRCAHLSMEDGLWYTGKCSKQMSYICKYKDALVPTPDPPVNGRCPDARWNDLGGSYCYLVIKEHKPWNEALRDCIRESTENTTSNLLSIHSVSELNLIVQLIAQINDPMWIGLTQFTDGFGWSDGTGLDFINWAPGEPNSDEERCVELHTHSGQWNDMQCDSARPFICKTKKAPVREPISSFFSGRDPNNSNSTGLWDNPAHSAGIIITIVFLVVFILLVLGFLVYRYYIKPRPLERIYSYSNEAYKDGILHSTSTTPAEDTKQIYVSIPL